MKGIAVFYKPKGWSSYDVIRFLKRELNEEKIGHGGTLDPIAEGVLVVGIKKEGTKKLEEFLKGKEKEYLATIALGGKTDTYDAQGKINYINVKRWPEREKVQKILQEFKKETLQTPPKFSAIKISGKPAYKLARAGKEVKLEPRKVYIHELELLNYTPPGAQSLLADLKVRLVVKSGFYVRSFANDLGEKLGTGGFLKELVRTRVGDFKIKEAITVDDFKNQNLELYFKAYGWVQGVGFRFFAQKWANILGVKGKAENLEDGGLEIIGQGQEKSLQEFLDKIIEGPPSARIKKSLYYFRKPQTLFPDFEIY
jgi:tRNA pseudouridine55 synthase